MANFRIKQSSRFPLNQIMFHLSMQRLHLSQQLEGSRRLCRCSSPSAQTLHHHRQQLLPVMRCGGIRCKALCEQRRIFHQGDVDHSPLRAHANHSALLLQLPALGLKSRIEGLTAHTMTRKQWGQSRKPAVFSPHLLHFSISSVNLHTSICCKP